MEVKELQRKLGFWAVLAIAVGTHGGIGHFCLGRRGCESRGQPDAEPSPLLLSVA
ncbi:putative fructoselysine transporter [Serratia fonticola]|uniref:Putative fructoselysine transporter n=1 Tax=Serratia fonticola TaxID=47917 RepID=A0A4U9W2P1_SERFO|nr:putative fructoselysine transporter [Serratia fonticola]